MDMVAHPADGNHMDLMIRADADDVFPEFGLLVVRDERKAAFRGEDQMDEVLRVCVCHGGRLSSLRDSEFDGHSTRHFRGGLTYFAPAALSDWHCRLCRVVNRHWQIGSETQLDCRVIG